MTKVIEILKEIGIDLTGKEADQISKEDVLNAINGRYISKELLPDSDDEAVVSLINAKMGAVKGATERKMKRALEPLGFDVTGKRFDDLSEMLDQVPEKVKELSSAEKPDDAKYKELEQARDNYKARVEELKQQNTDWEQKYKDAQQTHQQYVSNQTLTGKVEQAWKGIAFSDQANELTITGFKTKLNEKYNIRLPQEGEESKDGLIIEDKETKKRVNDGSSIISYKDLLEREAKEAGLLKLAGADNGGKKTIEPPKETEKPKAPYASLASKHLSDLEDTSK